MTISLNAGAGGTSGAIKIGGVDRLLLNDDGTLSGSVSPATGLRSAALATMQKFADEFGASLATNGYQKLPSGLIIQWGTYTLSGGTTAYNLPIAFPTVFLAGFLTDGNCSANSTMSLETFSVSQFKANASTSGVVAFMLAIGY